MSGAVAWGRVVERCGGWVGGCAREMGGAEWVEEMEEWWEEGLLLLLLWWCWGGWN